MLPYVKSYAFIAYVLGIVVPIGFITVLSWITGYYLPTTIPGVIASVALLAVCLLSAKRIATRMADSYAERVLSLYNDSCDPQAFVEQGRAIAERIRPPYEENGSWFLSFYALALDDIGQRDEAVRIGQTMLSSARRAEDPAQKVSLLVNMEPLISRLFGAQQTLDLIQEALTAAQESGQAEPGQVSFLQWEKSMLEAVRDGDHEMLAQRFSSVRTSGSAPMRMRVSDALLEASVRKARGERDLERECLDFVIRNGNKLPAVKLAQERIAAL